MLLNDSNWCIEYRPFQVFAVDETITFENDKAPSQLDRIILESVKFEVELEQMLRTGLISEADLTD